GALPEKGGRGRRGGGRGRAAARAGDPGGRRGARRGGRARILAEVRWVEPGEFPALGRADRGGLRDGRRGSQAPPGPRRLPGARLRRGAARNDAAARRRSGGGSEARAPARPRKLRRRLRAGGSLQARLLGADERADRQGRGGRSGGLDERPRRRVRGPRPDYLRDEARRRRRDLRPGRRAGDGGDGLRGGRGPAGGGHARRGRERLRRRGEAPALRPGRHRPACGPDRDPCDRRRVRPSPRRRRRPPRPGRARPNLPCGARDHLLQARGARPRRGGGTAERLAHRRCLGRGLAGLRDRRCRGARGGGHSALRRVRPRAPRVAGGGRRPLRGGAQELRFAVRRRADDGPIRRQGGRHQPHPANGRGGPLHRRAVGREVLEDAHLPAAHRGGEPAHGGGLGRHLPGRGPAGTRYLVRDKAGDRTIHQGRRDGRRRGAV
ncbi:MAG: putative histidinol dehydrogenase (but probably not), partial [uncultured Rubrobacteraceae bacterium]